MDTLAKRLIRSRGDMTQDALAKKANVSQALIAALENGRQSSSGSLPEIAHALGVDAYWLKTGVETIIAGDIRINDVVKLMVSMSNDGRAILLFKAKEISDEYRRPGLEKAA